MEMRLIKKINNDFHSVAYICVRFAGRDILFSRLKNLGVNLALIGFQNMVKLFRMRYIVLDCKGRESKFFTRLGTINFIREQDRGNIFIDICPLTLLMCFSINTSLFTVNTFRNNNRHIFIEAENLSKTSPNFDQKLQKGKNISPTATKKHVHTV